MRKPKGGDKDTANDGQKTQRSNKPKRQDEQQQKKKKQKSSNLLANAIVFVLKTHNRDKRNFPGFIIFLGVKLSNQMINAT